MNCYLCLVLTTVFIWHSRADPAIEQSGPSCEFTKLDLVLVVDVSGSVAKRFVANRNAALHLAVAMPISWDTATAIAIVEYSRTAVAKLEFVSHQETQEVINSTIAELEWVGGVANGADAMDMAMIQFRRSRPDAARAIVLFSDGNSMNTWDEVQAAAERLRYSNARIYAISLGGHTYELELNSYIGRSNGTIFRDETGITDLITDLNNYAQESCKNRMTTITEAKMDTKVAVQKRIKEAQRKTGDGEKVIVPTPLPSTPVPILGHGTNGTKPRRGHKLTGNATAPAVTGVRNGVTGTVPVTTTTMTTASTTTEYNQEARDEAVRKMIDRA